MGSKVCQFCFFLNLTFLCRIIKEKRKGHANMNNKSKGNPSRETCETIIRRILTTEVSEKGTNAHFRQASDFMSYFESLYPASDALTKQVQRAIKSMDMPKDEKGYFIINKTKEQLAQENELKHFIKQGEFLLNSMDSCETVFIKAPTSSLDYLIYQLSNWDLLKNNYITMVKSCNGILIYTKDKSKVLSAINSIITE